MAGRATLIKASVTSVSIYAMQTAILPRKICHHIDKLSCHFLLGDTDSRRGCHIVNWETVTLPKEAGGLGITSTRHRNQAILMNQAWRFHSTPSSLWAWVLKAKYFPQATLFTDPRTSRRSHIWTVISLGAELLLDGMRWFVGDGRTIRVWKDHWLLNGSLRDYVEGPLPPPPQEEDRRVNSLWANQTWSFESINLPLPPQIQELIQGIPMTRVATLDDSFLWPHNKGHAPSSPQQNFFSSVSWPRGIKPVGTKYGLPRAPRKSNFSSGRLCTIISPPKLSSHLDGRLWIRDARDVNLRKLRFTFFETILEQKRSSANPQVFCPYPSSICRFKNG